LREEDDGAAAVIIIRKIVKCLLPEDIVGCGVVEMTDAIPGTYCLDQATGKEKARGTNGD